MEKIIDKGASELLQLQDLVADLCKDGSSHLPTFTDTVDAALKKTSELSDIINGFSKSAIIALENTAVQLWNRTVMMKTKDSPSNVTVAKLRHIAFHMVTSCCSNSKEELTVKKQILMGMKTSRAWIDCKHFENAEKVLEIVNQMNQNLHQLLKDKNTEPQQCYDAHGEDRLDVEENFFKILSYRIEVFSGQNKHESALQCLQMAKEFLSRFPKEAGYLSMLCYNFGVNTYRSKQYSFCTDWLRESYDLGKGSVSSENQARTLRLLGNAYLHWNEPTCQEKAFNAITLANTEHLTPAGLFLKLQIVLASKECIKVIKNVAEDLIQHPDTSLDICHSVILLLRQSGLDLGSCPLESISLQRYQNMPEYVRLEAAYLDLLLQYHSSNAKAFAKDCVIAYSSKGCIDASSRKQFHIMFWEQAAQAFQEQRFSDSLDWYNYSLSLFYAGGSSCVRDVNVVKLHRNRANCYIALQELMKAKEALNEAKSIDPLSVHTHFLLYKVALMESDTAGATSSLQAMMSSQNSHQDNQNIEEGNNLICLAAQLAIEQKHESIAAMALDSLIIHLTDIQQALRASCCLVQLTMKQLELQLSRDQHRHTVQNLISQIRTAYNKLVLLSDSEHKDMDTLQNEIVWFMKVAWNLALNSKDELADMKEFFELCHNLLSVCVQDSETVRQQKVCTLMICAACIQMSRSALTEQDMKTLLEEALHYILENKSLDERLIQSSLTDEGKDQAQILMMLYEFEVLVKLGKPHADSVLERALVIPDPDPQIFESFAALAMEHPAQQSQLSVRALKVAIHTHLQAADPDLSKCSKDIHSLVQLSLSYSQEEAYTYIQEASDILNKKIQGKYPQMEILWLMTKAWNTGVRHYCSSNHKEAERWCALGMRFLPHMGSLRDTYEGQMMSVYTDILDGIEKEKAARGIEE